MPRLSRSRTEDQRKRDALHRPPVDRAKRRAAQKRYATKNSEKLKRIHRDSNYRRRYGITIEQRDAMLVSQGGKCACCGTDTPNNKRGVWTVDHDHKTKKVRGILCHNCNLALGHARDSRDVLRSLIAYLDTHDDEHQV